MTTRPVCACHGEPMHRNGIKPSSGTVKWRCAISNRERAVDWYVTAPYLKVALKALRTRRRKALERVRERETRYGSLPRA